MNGFWPRSAPEPGSSGLLVNRGVFFSLLLFFLLIQNLNCSDTLHHFQWIFNELLSSRSAVHAPDPSVLRLFLTLLLSWWRKCRSLRPKTSCNQSVCVRRELLLRSVTKPLTPDSLTSFIQTAPALTSAWEREHRKHFTDLFLCNFEGRTEVFQWEASEGSHPTETCADLHCTCFWKHEIMEQKPSNQSLIKEVC